MRISLALFLLAIPVLADVTPEQYLYNQPKPQFKTGHTLPPLTYSGWGTENSNTVVELAQNWGYAVDFTAPTPYARQPPLHQSGHGHVFQQVVLRHQQQRGILGRQPQQQKETFTLVTRTGFHFGSFLVFSKPMSETSF